MVATPNRDPNFQKFFPGRKHYPWCSRHAHRCRCHTVTLHPEGGYPWRGGGIDLIG